MYDIFSIDGGVIAPSGFYTDGISAGLKSGGKLDLAFIYSKNICKVESIFTQNRFQAAPISHYKSYGQNLESNFILINTRNANALTGNSGIKDVEWVVENLKTIFPEIKNPLMGSTGVIGVPLPKEKILEGAKSFKLDSKNNQNAREAIKTTDSFYKEIAVEVALKDGKSFRIGAMAKGAGMINPSLATMLCFITTDADVPREDMRELLESSSRESFNAISVDGDTSTNDTVMLFSNGESGAYEKDAFLSALKITTKKLALDMVRDGEGASKVVAFEIRGAKNEGEADRKSVV